MERKYSLFLQQIVSCPAEAIFSLKMKAFDVNICALYWRSKVSSLGPSIVNEFQIKLL